MLVGSAALVMAVVASALGEDAHLRRRRAAARPGVRSVARFTPITAAATSGAAWTRRSARPARRAARSARRRRAMSQAQLSRSAARWMAREASAPRGNCARRTRARRRREGRGRSDPDSDWTRRRRRVESVAGGGGVDVEAEHRRRVPVSTSPDMLTARPRRRRGERTPRSCRSTGGRRRRAAAHGRRRTPSRSSASRSTRPTRSAAATGTATAARRRSAKSLWRAASAGAAAEGLRHAAALRGGDARAVVRATVREYAHVSEAMHTGAPTTRAPARRVGHPLHAPRQRRRAHCRRLHRRFSRATSPPLLRRRHAARAPAGHARRRALASPSPPRVPRTVLRVGHRERHAVRAMRRRRAPPRSSPRTVRYAIGREFREIDGTRAAAAGDRVSAARAAAGGAERRARTFGYVALMNAEERFARVAAEDDGLHLVRVRRGAFVFGAPFTSDMEAKSEVRNDTLGSKTPSPLNTQTRARTSPRPPRPCPRVRARPRLENARR